MFEIGSLVVYRSEGICIVSDIREENFGAIGGKEKYYILTPLRDERSTLFVPVNNELLCGMMRKLLSAEEINALCDELRDTRMEWIEENRARGTEIRNILAVGDRAKLIVLVNTIMARSDEIAQKGKRITGGDENALRRAISMLYVEFSETSDISSEDDILPLLCGKIKVKSK